MLWISLIPALVTIIITFKTKKLITALFLGLLTGAVISKGIINGIIAVGEYMMQAVANKDSAYTLSFLVAFGSLAELIQVTGGIGGFSDKVGKFVKNERGVLVWSWILSIITFFHSSFHIISVGTVLTPILKKLNGSREKFAFVLSVTSSQIIVLIPIATTYLGYMVTLVANNIKNKGIRGAAYTVLVKSMLWNLLSWTMLLIALLVTIFGLGFGRFQIGKAHMEKDEYTRAHLEKEQLNNRSVEEYPNNSKNLFVPIIVLLTSTIFCFWWTGKDKASGLINALTYANFNSSIFSAIMFTILFTAIYYMFQKISLAEIEVHTIKGGEKMLSLVLVLILSWALTSVTRDLGFNRLVGGNFVNNVPRFLIPTIIFLISSAAAYMLGSSWATWALMMPLAINFSINSGISVSLMIGTVWAGGAVADVISPLAAQMADISYGKHLTTSFPYLIAGVIITAAAYLVVGMML